MIGRRRLMFALAGCPIGVLTAPSKAAAADEPSALWAALRSGEAVAMMRHALAPGTGDPAEFEIDDCSTQRNLSDRGRAQARAIGQRFRANGIERAEVGSSQWCRCLETARLLGLGDVEPMPALNSFFRDRDRGPAQTTALEDHLQARSSRER
ncbi:MAG: histidine phosphatase family protein, partial [Geminicoccaceae bacterium]|nr:histidine phosphatase family protein [Geminicoccaceae bacterium]